jgi:hypothetical protein
MSTEYYRPDSREGGFGAMLQDNWIPLSLIGVGVAWLVASNTGLAERVANDERVQSAGRRIGEIAGDLGIGGDTKHGAGHAGQLVEPDGRPLGHTGDADQSDGWVHQAAGAARGAISSVRDAGTAVLDRASRYTDYAGGASDAAKRATGQLAEKLERDPWLIGVAGMVAGALFAALLPPTRIEQEYISEARDELVTRANELGHEAAERVRELAETTARSSKP